ncbi:dihydrofolate reductase family protein, partial [Brevibacterium paucivorans]|uniref:dihydrofolate reductase family protein n=1 Tax=Brevibacterium paucivorans TaxID=170994 RepID=UPI0021554A15
TKLKAAGVEHLLVEGGPRLVGSFIGRGLADELLVYQAPVLLGDGLRSTNGLSVTTLLDAHAFTLDPASAAHPNPQVLGADVLLRLAPRSSLGALQPGDPVNLERCMPAGGRFDGHIVQGHVDGVGRVASVEDNGLWRTVRVNIPADLAPYTVEKGSISLSGTSLTLTAV